MLRTGLQRIGVILSVGWMAFIFGVAATQYADFDAFDEALHGACPTLNSSGYVYWRDAKSGKAIRTFREGETALNCEAIGNRARLLLRERDNRIIEPTVGINFLGLFVSILLPIVMLWVGSYGVGWTYGWVVDGFRKRAKPP